MRVSVSNCVTETALLKPIVNIHSRSYSDQYIRGENVNLMASMAKLKAGRLVREVADSCLQFWGGMGYSSETLISRLFRDLRLLSIGGGADEVMLGIICKLGKLEPSKKI